MSDLQRRVKQLEHEHGTPQKPVFYVCWHGPDDDCDCPPADVTITWEGDHEPAAQN